MLIVKETIWNKIKKRLLRLKVLNPKEKKKRKLFYEKIIRTFEHLELQGNFSKEKVEWKKMFVNMYEAKSNGPSMLYLESLFAGFAIEKLTLVKESVTKDDFSSPFVVCTQKDNFVYLKRFLPYYRNIGVKHFVFIDNGSLDGSFEYLNQQDDVTLFKAPYSFNGMKKAGWKLQTLAYIGLNHWCLWLDADEFLVYPQMENVKINEYVKKLTEKGLLNVGGFMLDMYPSYKMFDESENPENFYEDYEYFDADNQYYILRNGALYGGMRGRCLNIFNLRLDKTPLIFYTRDNFPDGNHTTFPRRMKLENQYGCVLKHYKFLSSDKEKYVRFSKTDGGYWNPKAQQKYLDLEERTVKNDNSVKFVSSNSISVFPFVKDFLKE